MTELQALRTLLAVGMLVMVAVALMSLIGRFIDRREQNMYRTFAEILDRDEVSK